MWTTAMLLGATASLMLLVACGDDSTSNNMGGAGGTGGTGTGGTATGGTASGGTGTGGSLPDGSCREEADCDQNMEFCLPAGASAGCGMCYTPMDPCLTDDECTAQGDHYICELPGCPCDDTKECSPGCTDNEVCGEARVCGADHRCEPQPCNASEPCPANYDCSSQTSVCTRRSCLSDSDCEGFCVLDECYDELGSCTPPAA